MMFRKSMMLAIVAGIALSSGLVDADEPITNLNELNKIRQKFIPYRKHDPLPGKVVGILLTDGQPILGSEGRSGPKDQLCLSADNCSYRWVYVPTYDKPTIRNLRVPIADGSKVTYPALTMANPKSVQKWNVVRPYALVEVEVNSGKGSPNISSFVATKMRVLDGTKYFPLKVAILVDEAKKAHAAYVKSLQDDIDKNMKQTETVALRGRKKTGPRKQLDLMYLTWLPKTKEIRFYFHTKITDGAYTYVEGGARPIRPFPLPPPPKGKKIIPPPPQANRAPLAQPRPPRFKVKVGTTFGVVFGVEFVVSSKGKITQTQTLGLQSFRQELAPPPVARPVPLPLPPPPRKPGGK